MRQRRLERFLSRVHFMQLYRGKTPDATQAYTEILPAADRILVQTRHTDAISLGKFGSRDQEPRRR